MPARSEAAKTLSRLEFLEKARQMRFERACPVAQRIGHIAHPGRVVAGRAGDIKDRTHALIDMVGRDARFGDIGRDVPRGGALIVDRAGDGVGQGIDRPDRLDHATLRQRDLVDRVAVMHRGQIVEHGTREQIFARPEHAYTRMLLASALTPEPGLGIPDIERELPLAVA